MEGINKIKYTNFEVIESNLIGTKIRILGLMKDKDFWKEYFNRTILSIKNYDDTQTTSIIIHNSDLDEERSENQ